mgnify:CR=1 FL=1
MKVFVLQHVNVHPNGIENVKMIGVYSEEKYAKEAIRRLNCKPGFSDSPSQFFIDAYELDHDHWSEGFVDEFRKSRATGE